MDFSIIKTAGLSQGELAYILDVTPLTAHKYCTGKSNPHHLLERRTRLVLKAISQLVEKKHLPRADLKPKDEERKVFIAKIKSAVDKFVNRALAEEPTALA